MTDFYSIWGSEIYITPSILEDTSLKEIEKIDNRFQAVQYDYLKREFTNIYVICEDCRKILKDLIHGEDNKSQCSLCNSEKLLYLPVKLNKKYEYRVNEKISDAEFLQILIELKL